MTGKKLGVPVAALIIVAALGACNRNAPKDTLCAGDVPAQPRIHDASPPNCPE